MRYHCSALALALAACHPNPGGQAGLADTVRLPTGQRLDPAGVIRPVGQMPLAMVTAPGGRRLVMLLNGYREQGVQVVDREGSVTQTLPQEAAFIGLAFSPDGRTLYASGGNRDLVYRYLWAGDSAARGDSLVLAAVSPDSDGTRYPAGLAVNAAGDRLFVAENLADSLAVIDLASGRVVQRVATGRYPYAVVATPDGVFVSNWGASTVSAYTAGSDGRLGGARTLPAGRHPSAMIANAAGTRLFVASGSTDRVTVLDARTGARVAELLDPPPGGVREGSTPNALALSPDGTRLFAAEADANAVAVFDLSAASSGVAGAAGDDRLAGRIPAGWYPTALAVLGDSLIVANGKGGAAGPNPELGQPGVPRPRPDPAAERRRRQYTLGQIAGTLGIAPLARASGEELAALTRRVARANGWDAPAAGRPRYPPFAHVLYIIRENRTYDQVLGDLPGADGDTALLFFGRAVTPNAHALAERFGIFDRFFVNAEVSADGHNWSTAAYATDYTQKTAPTNYGGDGRSYDYEGENRGVVPEDDAAEPAQGYLWDLAERAGITLRNFGEYTRGERDAEGRVRYRGTKRFLAAHTNQDFAAFDMRISDQRRTDVFLAEFRDWVAAGRMPALTIMHLPRDHTEGASAGQETPRAMVADNDLALGRIVEALTASPFWRSTVVFVVEDDAQDGPDHVDSHRAPFLAISAWNRGGVLRRFTNTTDVIRTIEEILGLDRLSQFDAWGRPLRDIWAGHPDTARYAALTPAQSLEERNPARTRGALESRRLDLATVDAADMDLFNRILWRAIKGDSVPYPGPRRMSALEARRAR